MTLQSEMYTEFDKDPTPIVDFMRWLAATHHLPETVQVLDIGCGPGRMLAEYAKLGWQVTGMEPDADFYEAAQTVMVEIPGGRVFAGGFGDLNFDAEFDLVTAINNPISYLLDVPARVDALERVHQALKPGGVFFFEITNFLYKIQHFEPVTTDHKEVDGKHVTHIMENHVDLHEGRWVLKDQYFFDGEQEPVVKEHEQAVIILPELIYLLEQQSFTDIQTFGSYQERESETVTGKHILVAAHKPPLMM